MIPRTTEDIREYMLQTLLPGVDLIHELEATGRDSLEMISESVEVLGMMLKNGIGLDWPIYLGHLTTMSIAVLGHWERMHTFVLKTGVRLPDSEGDWLKVLRETGRAARNREDANNQDQG